MNSLILIPVTLCLSLVIYSCSGPGKSLNSTQPKEPQPLPPSVKKYVFHRVQSLGTEISGKADENAELVEGIVKGVIILKVKDDVKKQKSAQEPEAYGFGYEAYFGKNIVAIDENGIHLEPEGLIFMGLFPGKEKLPPPEDIVTSNFLSILPDGKVKLRGGGIPLGQQAKSKTISVHTQFEIVGEAKMEGKKGQVIPTIEILRPDGSTLSIAVGELVPVRPK